MLNKRIVLVITLFFIILFTNPVLALQPDGANVSQISTSKTNSTHAPTSVPAFAGNVSEINIFGYSATQTWQGYFGNVTGTIVLSDANDNVMYNWSVASPQGEIYASTNSSILWSNIQCLNFSASGTLADDSAQAGGTSLYGTNLSYLENYFGVTPNDVDGLDETFSYYGAGGHSSFFTANNQFSSGECRNTRIFDSNGAGTEGNFEEVLLYEPVSTSVIFAALLEDNLLGFDNRQHDFQLMVMDDGHGTNLAPTTYYFYVEIE